MLTVRRTFIFFVPVLLCSLGLAGCSDNASNPSSAADAGSADSTADRDRPDTHELEAGPPPPDNVVHAVWAIHDGERVERDDLSNSYKESNSAWDGETIKIFGARNEVVAFQLIVETGASGANAVSVSLPELRHRTEGDLITYAPPSADPTDYVGKPIQVFSEHYMNVTTPTEADWITSPGNSASPSDMLGWKPVQLVPENAAQGRGGFPLSVGPEFNQAFWFDVYAGKDLPAGIYDGVVTVHADGGSLSIPLELELFDFALPDENSLHYMLYFESSQVEQYHGADYEARYHRLAHRNRVEFVDAYNVQSAQAKMERFRGGDFTPSQGYAGPGEGVGNTIIPRTFYGPGNEFDTQASARAASDAWMSFLQQNLPDKITLLYMPDEPSSSEYAYIQDVADRIHTNPGPGSALPIFLTRGYTSALSSAIDVWCSIAGSYEVERAELERTDGGDFWYYNGQRPHVGSLVIDAPATDARVHGWASFKHSVPVYFYWHTDHWRHNGNAPSDYERNQDVWAEPITFRNRHNEFANGDGVLVYPGREVLHPDQDRGVEGPISTVRLANLRRGAQDHLYLTLARKKGLDAMVVSALDTIVPAVFSEAGSSVSFPEHGDEYEAVRYSIAQALAASP